MKRLLVVCAVALTVGGTAHAGTIDFEGFSDGVEVTSINTGDNVVGFIDAAGPQAGLVSRFNAVAVGGPPGGFAPDDMPDPGIFGGIFLTDEFDTTPGLDPDGAYGLSFLTGVTSLSLDVADFRNDGGGAVGDSVILRLYASDDLTGSVIGSDGYTIVAGTPDGFATTLSVTLGAGLVARSASVMNATHADVGTGIDNVEFDTVPEPGTLAIWATLVGVVGYRRKHRSRK